MKKIVLLFLLVIIGCSSSGNIPISKSLEKLLRADYNDNGFVIFEDPETEDYVQYALEEKGLLLVWPYFSDYPGHQTADIDKVKDILNKFSFSEDLDNKPVDRNYIVNMNSGEYIYDSDTAFPGIYAMCGTDVQMLESLTIEFFKEIYGFSEIERLKTQLVLENW
ncbi:hypothetical protein K7I13_05535 [Brucepastera parasyntrophica]|uniref:hypothetical protein n=1 Tax=Brucepastera parasyntrophica TaxID=2880008 RepID=UPI00210EAFDF|nr:hypothetical protein [Brucepastera parasyntrophica]ULQ60733.1 hypothetical protein K7I13_05535 [Brucepastera parasyntrophica]